MDQPKISMSFSVSDNYAQHLAVVLASVLCHNRNHNFVFHVLHRNITPESERKVKELETMYPNCRIEFHKVDVSRFRQFHIPAELEHVTQETYYRYILPEVLVDEDRTIYSDVDVLCVGDLKPLWEMDLKGNILAAVSEGIGGEFKKELFALEGDAPYFYAGLLVVDLKAMREGGYVEKLMAKTAELGEKLAWPDQDVINIVFRDKILQLGQEWDGINVRYSPFKRGVVIWHFPGVVLKPWCNIWKNITWMPYLKYLLKSPYRRQAFKFVWGHIVGFFYFAYTKKQVRRVLVCGIRVWKCKLGESRGMSTRMRYMWAKEFKLRLSRERYRVFVRQNGGEPKPLEMGKGKWNADYCADPFLFRHDGVNWLFYETLDKTGKGVLGCFKEVDGNWIQQGIVLEESCHLSYPQVFAEDGKIYMIPESSDGGRGQVFLYEAVDFPRKWAKRALLISAPLADATLVKKDGRYYLSALRMAPGMPAELWEAPKLTGPWTLHPQSANTNQSRRLRRNGGAFQTIAGRLYRIAQDCNGYYGKRLFKVPVEELAWDRYSEGSASLLLEDNWGLDGKIHTYNRLEADGATWETVDLNERVRFGICRRVVGILRIIAHSIFSISFKRKRGFRLQICGVQFIAGEIKRRPALVEIRMRRWRKCE